MTKKPFRCPDCGQACLEVGKPQYPKGIYEPNMTRVFHEYRFACLKCRKEWLKDTLLRLIFDVPGDSQFYFDFNDKHFKLRRLNRKTSNS